MNTKLLAALIVLGVAGFWARAAFAKSASATTSGVDRDSRLSASPVKGAANESVSQTTRKGAATTRVLFNAIPSSAFQQPRRLQPFGTVESQAAAYKAPIFALDTPSDRLTSY